MKKFLYYFLMKSFRKDSQNIVKSNPDRPIQPITPIYSKEFVTIDNKLIPMDIFKGKYILIANTASECGYTPQLKDLQILQDKFQDKLVVVGFPSNEFAGQEPLSGKEIAAFCIKNYGVNFQIAEKTNVLQPNQNKVYKWLTDPKENGWNHLVPTWNFCKYLISPRGELLGFFPSAISPTSEDITRYLK